MTLSPFAVANAPKAASRGGFSAGFGGGGRKKDADAIDAFAVAKTSILLGAGELVGAIDELIRTATWDQFVVLLPRVRHAFERLHDRQRMTFAGRVAESYGIKEAAEVAKLSTSLGAAVQMAAIDTEVAAIMKEWTF